MLLVLAHGPIQLHLAQHVLEHLACVRRMCQHPRCAAADATTLLPSRRAPQPTPPPTRDTSSGPPPVCPRPAACSFETRGSGCEDARSSLRRVRSAWQAPLLPAFPRCPPHLDHLPECTEAHVPPHISSDTMTPKSSCATTYLMSPPTLGAHRREVADEDEQQPDKDDTSARTSNTKRTGHQENRPSGIIDSSAAAASSSSEPRGPVKDVCTQKWRRAFRLSCGASECISLNL